MTKAVQIKSRRRVLRPLRIATSAVAASAIVLATGFGEVDATESQPAKALYPTAAPIKQYLIENAAEEIALARSAAPPSISADAAVLVLGDRGYETAVRGKNRFVCFVQRSWAANFADTEFWNPKNPWAELLQRVGRAH